MVKKGFKVNKISLILMLLLSLAGLFHEFVSCAAAALLCFYLLYLYCKNGFKLYLNPISVSITAITAFYLVSSLWAVDGGAALTGFFKILPLPLFLIALMQEECDYSTVLKPVPYFAAAMTVASALLMQFNLLKDYFSVAGRLSGFFQYSNTFALFLLVSIVILAEKESFKPWDLITVAVLLFGIIYSGSRTVFALTVVTVLALIIMVKNKKVKLSLLLISALLVAAAAAFALVTDNFSAIGRFLTTSFTRSTFVGRLLYFYDALPVILKHPFGLGYMGYYYTQQAFQTGLYSVKYIHNDFLQLLLDIGWLPTGAFVYALVRSVFKKGISSYKRLALLIICAHSCFDFDLQFTAVFMLLLCFTDYSSGRSYELKGAKAAVTVSAVLTAALSVYMCTALALYHYNMPSASLKLYPLNTQAKITLLQAEKDLPKAQALADDIIKHNKYCSAAYGKKAVAAYSEGDFKKVMEYGDKALDLAPFSYTTYENYCYMLINGAMLYQKAGDRYSADVCTQKLAEVAERLDKSTERLSYFGKRIKDRPQTELPEEILKYLNK